MIRNRYAALALFAVLVVVVWDLLDYLYTTVIAGQAFVFSAAANVFIPLACALAVGYILFFLNRGEKQ